MPLGWRTGEGARPGEELAFREGAALLHVDSSRAAMALVIVGLGAGRLSLDALIGRRLSSTDPSGSEAVEGRPSAMDGGRTRSRADPLPR